MKILVKAYTVLNLGDDLLLHLLFTRYPDIQFELEIGNFAQAYQKRWNYSNVTIKSPDSLLLKIQRKLGYVPINRKRLAEYDAIVYLGGSIFMENPQNNALDILFRKTVRFAEKKKLPVVILNCNFGPYQTEAYRQDKKDCFARCRQVCFRDRYSYQLFEQLSQATYAPDMVFSYHHPVKKQPGTLGISLISLKNRPALTETKELYNLFLDQLIQRHFKDGYDIVLFDFCSEEGDGEAAEEVVSRHSGKRIEIVHYDGSLKLFLDRFLSMERLVATRFHAMVLAAAHKIPCLPVVYSPKMRHVIEDLSLTESYVDLEHPHNAFGKLQFSQWQGATEEMQQDVFGIFERIIVKN